MGARRAAGSELEEVPRRAERVPGGAGGLDLRVRRVRRQARRGRHDPFRVQVQDPGGRQFALRARPLRDALRERRSVVLPVRRQHEADAVPERRRHGRRRHRGRRRDRPERPGHRRSAAWRRAGWASSAARS